MKNILWLRIFLVMAAVIYIISGISLGISSMVGWNTAYLVINGFHIVILLLERVTIDLPANTKEIYHQYFSILTTREFKKLITTNPFLVFSKEVIIREAMVPDRLFIVLEGEVNIVKAGRSIAWLQTGDLIGEMSFMSKDAASANALAVDEATCAYWSHDDLEKLKAKNLNTYNKFISIIGRDLVRKLKRENQNLVEQKTELDFII